MFQTIISPVQPDKDLPERSYAIDMYSRVRDGTLYDHIPNGFHSEKAENGDYIPLRNRRPSARHNICRIVADDSISLLFSEGHFPEIKSDDEPTKDGLHALVKDLGLNKVMIDTATEGSVGSVAIQARCLQQDDKSYRLFLEPHSTEYLTPTFKPNAPDTLAMMREQYKITGAEVEKLGYKIEEGEGVSWFWFARDWDDREEIWYVPWPVVEDKKRKPFVKDAKKSVNHGIGFVPWVWVKNLPGKLKLLTPGKKPSFSDIDGACTFAGAIDTMIEIDYLLSQGGRGLKYTMDPLLFIKEPAAPDSSSFVRSPSNALVGTEKGDAKLLEIGGGAFTVVLEYAKGLRELAIENIHGNRSDPQKLSAATSGRAMELMQQALIWLADKLRISYGEGALKQILKMALAIHEKFPLTVCGKPLGKVSANAEFTLQWPQWHHPTYDDLLTEAQALDTATKAGIISRETAVTSIATNYDIEDVDAELAQIDADIQAASAILINEAAQVKASTSTPT